MSSVRITASYSGTSAPHSVSGPTMGGHIGRHCFHFLLHFQTVDSGVLLRLPGQAGGVGSQMASAHQSTKKSTHCWAFCSIIQRMDLFWHLPLSLTDTPAYLPSWASDPEKCIQAEGPQSCTPGAWLPQASSQTLL